MNKLFIIGNGFDLAHGYPTKYDHFLKWIWNNIQKNPLDNRFNKLLEINSEFTILGNFVEGDQNNINCYDSFNKAFLKYNDYQSDFRNNGIVGFINGKKAYEFKNMLFYSICKSYPNSKWSDIESLFYKKLIDVLEVKNANGYSINKLNDDMEVIKNLFENYLLENITYEEVTKDMSFFKMLEYRSQQLNKSTSNDSPSAYLNEFSKKYHDKLRNRDKEIDKAESISKWDSSSEPQTLILDFNYTKTIENYLNIINTSYYLYGNVQHIKIHGEVNNPNNPINLGFGDEMDDYYKILEKKNNNLFLRYIKSFMYLNNSNYRNLLDWIDTYEFQVIIIGHSCGLSDRIMLNTIFEHLNCASIKVYFYKDIDGSDDFTEKIQNISRHFNKKSLMREKIVDKSLCEPLKLL